MLCRLKLDYIKIWRTERLGVCDKWFAVCSIQKTGWRAIAKVGKGFDREKRKNKCLLFCVSMKNREKSLKKTLPALLLNWTAEKRLPAQQLNWTVEKKKKITAGVQSGRRFHLDAERIEKCLYWWPTDGLY